MKRILLLLFALSGACSAAPAGSRPNVLLICVDDLKPLLGCYGDSRVRTPNIDRLAARGVVFDRAYCNQAVCAPSRNALMTGLRPTTLGIYDLGTNFRVARPDAVTVAQQFRAQGYRTAALGKVLHTGHGNHDDAASWSEPPWRRGSDYALPANRAAMEAKGGKDGRAEGRAKGTAVECADVPDTAYADGLIAEEAVRRLEAAGSRPEEPFFLAVGFLKPHLPFCAPKRYWDLYRRDQFEPHPRTTPPDGAPDFAPTTWGELRAYTDVPNTGPLSAEQQRELIHGYHAAVSYMDAQVGRVLDALHRLGLADRTIIVLWGDHGWHLGDHGMWCKHTNYEEAARIPLILCAPGHGKGGGRWPGLVETVDLFPTLCDLAGLPVPAGLDGRSVGPVLDDPASARAAEAVFHCYPLGRLMGRAVRTERYRLVEWKPIGAPAEQAVLELYDYQQDPGETRNLAVDQPEVVAALRTRLAALPEANPQVRAPGKPDKTRDP